MSRYHRRNIFRTSNAMYKELLKKRGLNEIRYYETPRFQEPGEDELFDIEDIAHLWSSGDRYYKLAQVYYGDPTLWWIIAWYNAKPTEAHVKAGDVIKVPTPLWKVRAMVGI
tara:strand:+ start:118 stop:453 length:336 start_codon:yes stop_codon:yes gene_type:complete